MSLISISFSFTVVDFSFVFPFFVLVVVSFFFFLCFLFIFLFSGMNQVFHIFSEFYALWVWGVVGSSVVGRSEVGRPWLARRGAFRSEVGLRRVFSELLETWMNL